MYPYGQESIERAINALVNMSIIVENEMVASGSYITDVVDTSKTDAICGGRKACAIGSLWVGYGIEPVIIHRENADVDDVILPGVDQNERREFFREHPGLGLAYKELNNATDRWIKDHPGRYQMRCYQSSLEGLFEGSYPDFYDDDNNSVCQCENCAKLRSTGRLTREDLLFIIASAKEEIEGLVHDNV